MLRYAYLMHENQRGLFLHVTQACLQYLMCSVDVHCLFRRRGLNRSIHMDYLQCYELLKAIVELTFIEGTEI